MDILSINFDRSGKLHTVIQMSPDEDMTTKRSKEMIDRLFTLMPEVESHKCWNDHKYPFRKEAANTEIPHLLEHIIIELQSRVHHGFVFSGKTEWNWDKEPKGRFHVYVDYTDELVAIAALRLACKVLKIMKDESLNVGELDFEIDRLRDIAQESRNIGNMLEKVEEDPLCQSS